MKINIAIDGPSAAGKSTIAKALAKKLDYVHLDTGAMYRCIAYKSVMQGLDLEDEEKIIEMMQDTVIEMKPDGSIFLDGNKVGNEIRTNEMSMASSKVSMLKGVRAELVALQQKIAENKGIIMDGRDIGTVVLPDAEVKIFLTASAEARAMRRHLENQEKGIPSDLNALIEEINQRDYQDTHRANSPLRQAEDAIRVDSSDLTIDEEIDMIYQIVLRKLQG